VQECESREELVLVLCAFTGLSAREVTVLRLVACGLGSGQIAARLCLSERTARQHANRILVKLGLESRLQAALWAWWIGLVRLEDAWVLMLAAREHGCQHQKAVVAEVQGLEIE
jgi:DNA-binding CsgD family transcriptional regulator